MWRIYGCILRDPVCFRDYPRHGSHLLRFRESSTSKVSTTNEATTRPRNKDLGREGRHYSTDECARFGVRCNGLPMEYEGCIEARENLQHEWLRRFVEIERL